MYGPASHVDVAASKAVKASPGQLVAVLLAPGSAAATLTIYDDPDSADGTVLAKLVAQANGDAIPWAPAVPYAFAKGCYADISGSGANGTVVIL